MGSRWVGHDFATNNNNNASHLLQKHLYWAPTVLDPEQIGFTKGKSTIDHYLTLFHLAEKYTCSKKGKLYAAFLDLKCAFNSIPKASLWSKLGMCTKKKFSKDPGRIDSAWIRIS